MNFPSSSHLLLPWLGDIALQSTLMISALLALSSAGRWLPPAKRHLLLSLGLCSIPVLMAASLVSSGWQWQWQWTPPFRQEPKEQARWRIATPPQQADTPSAPAQAASPPHQVVKTDDVHPLLVIWLAGLTLGLAGMARSAWRLHRLKTNGCNEIDPALLNLLHQAKSEAGLRQSILLLRAHDNLMPMTWGTFRPVIMLPLAASSWSQQRLLLVLRHEVAHIVRRDAAVSTASMLAALSLWFHPLVWIALRRAAALRETACDDHVLRLSGEPPQAYAGELLATIRSLRDLHAKTFTSPALAIGMASLGAGALRSRLASVLRHHADRSAFGKSGLCTLILLLIAITALLSGLCACRESKNNPSASTESDPERVYFLTDSQWRNLIGATRLPTAPPVDPYSGQAPQPLPSSPAPSLTTAALTIRSRLLQEGINFPSDPKNEVLTLRDERTLLVRADTANHEKISAVLASLATEQLVSLHTRVFTVPLATSVLDDLGLDNNASSAQTLNVLGILNPASAARLFKKLEQTKDAVLMTAPSVTTRNGQHAIVETVREFIYPTQFEPPQWSTSTKQPDGVMTYPVTPTTPIAFDMRPVGLRIEFEPEIIGGGSLQLSVAPELTFFEGYVNFGSPIHATAKNALGAPVEVLLTENKIEQPVFRTTKCQTSVVIKDGDSLVLGGLGTKKTGSTAAKINTRPNQIPDLTDNHNDIMVYFIIRAQIVSK